MVMRRPLSGAAGQQSAAAHIAGAGRGEHQAIQFEATSLAEGTAQPLVEDGAPIEFGSQRTPQRETKVGETGLGALGDLFQWGRTLGGVSDLHRHQSHVLSAAGGDLLEHLGQ